MKNDNDSGAGLIPSTDIRDVKIENLEMDIKSLESKIKALRADNNSFLYTALCKAQGEFPIIRKDATSFGNQKYASLANMKQASQKILFKNGLLVSQNRDLLPSGEEIYITELCHISGQKKESKSKIPILSKTENMSTNDLHKERGKAESFTKRQAYKSILGLTEED